MFRSNFFFGHREKETTMKTSAKLTQLDFGNGEQGRHRNAYKQARDSGRLSMLMRYWHKHVGPNLVWAPFRAGCCTLQAGEIRPCESFLAFLKLYIACQRQGDQRLTPSARPRRRWQGSRSNDPCQSLSGFYRVRKLGQTNLKGQQNTMSK
ncbi:hypothetical protein PoB_000649200 [Plakobranchus ocellatus]|uniref:Uncharacterized protein n=1 Tax=Plakobranchus ocellatus TaxID=259542 RepID=A0AAV3YD05_9GAST|nr:hypothetical protein PoB_000649200 [Plakobranchus ocellatus]